MPVSSDNRRQTLGAVSNTAKRRDSIGGGASSSTNNNKHGPPGSSQKVGERSIRKSRVSMIPRVGRENAVPPSPGVTAPTAASRRRSVGIGGGGGNSRRQTMGGGASSGLPPLAAASPARNALPPISGTAVRTDPRPIHDKAFQQQCMKKLLNFLLKNNYEYPVTQKSLSRPSGKDFANIVTFMLRQVDPTFQENTGGGKDNIQMKLEDEIAMNFKALGYPFPISKTALVAAGSPHTWPTLLAALTWLTELLEILQEDIEEDIIIGDAKPFESLEELEMTTDKVFFAYLHKAYTAFLQGDEALQEQLENALADRFEKDDGHIEQEIERVTDLNAVIVEQMNKMAEVSTQLTNKIKERDDYITDLEQFRDLNRQMDEHLAGLNQKVKERSEQLVTTNEKIETMNKIVCDLKKTLEKQAVSLGDIYKVQSELKGVDEAMERAFAVKEKLRKSKWENEEQLGKFFTDLENLIADFNAALAEIALLPCMGEEVKELKVVLDKNQALQKNRKKLLGVDLENDVDQTLQRYKELYLQKTATARQDYQEAIDDLEVTNEKLSEAIDKLKSFQTQKTKCEESYESERKTHEAKLAVRLREVEAIESSVSSINDPIALEEQMAKYESQIAELEVMRFHQQEENLGMKKAVEDEIEAACQAVMELQNFCQAKAAEVSQYWMMKRTMNSETVKTSEDIHVEK